MELKFLSKKFYKLNIDFINILIITITLAPFFFYKLGSFSLQEFDEAWYAVIAKNILTHHNLFPLIYDNRVYYDHPPLGFVLMAISMFVFGINEFSVRFPSAFLGFLSIIAIYMLGKELFNRKVSFVAAYILASSIWFIYRARSGNLDSILIFFYITTFYFAAKLKKNPKWIYALVISAAALFLSKSVIGLTITVPVAAFIIINKIRVPRPKIFKSVFIFSVLTFSWYIIYFFKQHVNVLWYQAVKALRVGQRQSINFLDIQNSLTFIYLHFGIRKWYYPSLISTMGSVVFLFKYKNLIPLYLWIAVLLYGFLPNRATEIWHLLPLYIPIALIVAFFLDKIVTEIVKSKHAKNFISKLIPKKNIAKFQRILATVLIITPVFFISGFQLYKARYELNLMGGNIGGLAYVSQIAKKYPQDLYLNTDLLIPSVALFYSDKNVIITHDQKNLLATANRPFLLISETWRMKIDNIDPSQYQTLAEKDGQVLILVN